MEKESTKMASPVKGEAPKTESKAPAKVEVKKFPELEQYREEIKANNIKVVLFVGHENSPNHFEVQLNNVANEIKNSLK